jgi:tRNA dimethylallyltransferase
MQIYKYMQIGTAAPTIEEQDGVPHHLFGIIDPKTDFSLAQYAKLAHEKIAEVAARGKLPIIVGGTGLYIDTVAQNIILSEDSISPELRARLQSQLTEELFANLTKIDPKYAAKIKDRRRAIRALEIYESTGHTISEQQTKSQQGEKLYNAQYIGITLPREVLYDRINRRVDIMISQGLVAEVELLIKHGIGKTASQAIGYKEIIAHLQGEYTQDEAIEKIKINTRHYAKRQETWFKRNEAIKWQ